MRVAVYARYSSEGQRETSIVDQSRNCERWAQREGVTITHRYKDEALSGSLGVAGRPGYQQMLADAESRRFDVLLVDDFSRLSRDQVETEQVRRRLIYWGVRLVGVSDGIDTANKNHKMLSNFRGIINESYLDTLREHTHRGMSGQALNGYHCGGRVYGYKLVPEYHPTKTDPYGRPAIVGTRLQIDPDHAKWVQWIFERYAEGWSPRKIVEALNAQQLPPPGAAYRRKSARSPSWCASALHGDLKQGTGLLNNLLYTGQAVWNRSNWLKHPDTKKYRRVLRPTSEWIVTPMPHLRIIDDALWERVKRRQREIMQGSAAIRASLHRNARTGRGPKYLFSGLLICGECRGKFVISDPSRYACSSWLYRGQSVCSNRIKVSRAVVEARLLDSIQRDLFTEEALALFKRETSRLLMERRRTSTPDRSAKARLTEVEQKIAHMVSAIKDGFRSETLKQELEQAERERARLHDEVYIDVKRLAKVTTFLPQATKRFKALVTNLASTVTQHDVDRARGILKELVGREIPLHPAADGGGRYLMAHVSGNYAGLTRLLVGQNKFGGGQGI